MKINSKFLRELANNDFFLHGIECINFFTYWDLMVFPGWWTNLNFGKKISVKVFKHRNLVRNKSVVDKIIDEIIMKCQINPSVLLRNLFEALFP